MGSCHTIKLVLVEFNKTIVESVVHGIGSKKFSNASSSHKIGEK